MRRGPTCPRIAAALEREYPDTNTRWASASARLHDWFLGDLRQALLMLMAGGRASSC